MKSLFNSGLGMQIYYTVWPDDFQNTISEWQGLVYSDTPDRYTNIVGRDSYSSSAHIQLNQHIHDMYTQQGASATCTSYGTTYHACRNCSYSYSTTNYNDPYTGHNYKEQNYSCGCKVNKCTKCGDEVLISASNPNRTCGHV
jgi:hypothetical protein